MASRHRNAISFRRAARPSSLMVALLAALLLPAITRAQTFATVVDYQLISSERFDRTQFDYIYRVRVRSVSPDFVMAVSGSVTSSNPATSIVSGTVTFGDLPSNATMQSAGTIRIRQDRTVPFSPQSLVWQLTGQVVSGAIPPADPGPPGLSSIDGIDANANGVRDDVERRILGANPPGDVRDALMSIARHLRSGIAARSNQGQSVLEATSLLHTIQCLFSLDPERARAVSLDVTASMLNTADRTRAYFQFGQQLHGQAIEHLPGLTPSALCAAL